MSHRPTFMMFVQKPVLDDMGNNNRRSPKANRHAGSPTGPDISARPSTYDRADEVLRHATDMVNAIRTAKDFVDLKAAVTLFIASMDFVVLGDGDLLELAAAAIIHRGKSAQVGSVLFNLAFTRAAETRSQVLRRNKQGAKVSRRSKPGAEQVALTPTE